MLVVLFMCEYMAAIDAQNRSPPRMVPFENPSARVIRLVVLKSKRSSNLCTIDLVCGWID